MCIRDRATADSLVRAMLPQYQSEVAGLDYSYAESQGLTAYDVLKLASIVERESDPEHFATVASVFYNRLASDRPYLESDATTAYEVGRTPTADEVHADTPYSTYANPGLPPTPICAPSIEALKAVCAPEQTDYLYFYTKPVSYTHLDVYKRQRWRPRRHANGQRQGRPRCSRLRSARSS